MKESKHTHGSLLPYVVPLIFKETINSQKDVMLFQVFTYLLDVD